MVGRGGVVVGRGWGRLVERGWGRVVGRGGVEWLEGAG